MKSTSGYLHLFIVMVCFSTLVRTQWDTFCHNETFRMVEQSLYDRTQ